MTKPMSSPRRSATVQDKKNVIPALSRDPENEMKFLDPGSAARTIGSHWSGMTDKCYSGQLLRNFRNDINAAKQITIFGCGLSGMITALGLAHFGIKTTIIEARQAFLPGDNRTTAINTGSKEVLVKWGLWADIEALAGKMLDIYVLDNKSAEMVHLKSPAESSVLGYIVPNRDFKKVLLERVLNNELITLIDECPYTKIESSSDSCRIHLNNGQIINSDLVILCDGQNSMARKKYFTNRLEKSYGQVALTFNVWHEKDHEGTAVEHFMSSGPFAILPLKSEHHSSIVWSLNEKAAPIFQGLSKEEFTYHLNQNFGNSLGAVEVDSEINAFPLRARIANKYFYQRIVLVADTAHIIHPLAGQGLNQGIKDIDTLVNLIYKTHISLATLETYQVSRQDDNMTMYHLTDCLNSIFANEFYTLRALRQAGLALVDIASPLKNLLLNYAGGAR